MVGTYNTETLDIASQIITHPWFPLIAFGIVAFFMIIMVFAIVPAVWTRQSFRGGK